MGQRRNLVGVLHREGGDGTRSVHNTMGTKWMVIIECPGLHLAYY